MSVEALHQPRLAQSRLAGFWSLLFGLFRREPAAPTAPPVPRTTDPLSAGYEAVERLSLLDLGWQPPYRPRRR